MPQPAPPRVWVLASPHTGDNRQLMALANGLDWPHEVKQLSYRWHEGLVRLAGRPTLSALDARSRRSIVAPYPDLIIAAGRPTEAVAMWIRRHGNPAVKIVFVGTPWTPLERFDLVIATPQYRMPSRTNVLHNALPLHDVEPQKLAKEAKAWSARLAHLPRPLTAVLVGGSSGPYVFSPRAATRLGQQASRIAQQDGGALLISTSARTSPDVTDALFAAITVPHHAYRYAANSGENPFFAYLAQADRIIVTADSVSMISEATATGKPVLLFDIEEGRRAMRAEERQYVSDTNLPKLPWRGADLSSTAFRLAMRMGPPRWSRDLRIIHRSITKAGQASWIDDPQPSRTPLPRQDLEHAVDRIRHLMEPVMR